MSDVINIFFYAHVSIVFIFFFESNCYREVTKVRVQQSVVPLFDGET